MKMNIMWHFIFITSIITACSPAPSESSIQTAISQTLAAMPTNTLLPPTPTAIPTDTPTTIPTATPTAESIPLMDVDLKTGLLKPEDISFLGLAEPEKWAICDANLDFFNSWHILDEESYIKEAGTIVRYPDCTSFENDFEIKEHIFLTENPRQAARVAEAMKPTIEWVVRKLCAFTSELVSVGDESIWLLRGEAGIEISYIIVVHQEAILYIAILGSKLVKNDLLDLATSAVNKLKSAQIK